MEVTRERFEDCSERSVEGYYDWYYSGVIYRFVFPARALVARCYDETPGEASFLRVEARSGRRKMGFSEIPYRDPEFREAVKFLRAAEGIDVVHVLLPCGYAPVDLKAIEV